MPRVLFIAYYFPPIGGSGVQRPTKFVKYLPRFGWQPYVISTDRTFGEEGVDETLLADIPPDIKVWRVPTPRPRPVERLQRLVGWKPKPPVSPRALTATTGEAHSERIPLVKRTRRALLLPLHLIQQPPIDDQLYWSLRIVPLARRIIRQEQIDVVFTTVPPWSALLTGAVLQSLTGRPWVADFRDPWTDNTFIYFPSHARRWFDEQMERLLVNQADAVLCPTEPSLQDLRKKAVGSGLNKPFVLVPNGWDPVDFLKPRNGMPDLLSSQRENDKITLLHAGSTYLGEPIPLLRALERLSDCESVIGRLRFHLVGYIHPEDQARITGSPLRSLFRIQRHRVPHPVAIQLMRESHVLLLLRKGPHASSGKIFEYMVAGRPVLAIASGVAADLVQHSGIGQAVPPEDYEGLSNVLRQIALDYKGFVARYYHPNWDVINQYDRRVLTERLAHTFDAVLASSVGDG